MYTSFDLEQKRLSRQCRVILERLRQGRVSNRELSQIACNYTARISTLRQTGHNVRIVERDFATGQTWYALHVSEPEQLTLTSEGVA